MRSVLLLVLSAVLAQSQTLSQLDPATANRSGLVILKGVGLGTSGLVTIDGLPAAVASWTSTDIAAYVPETARLGQVGVYVSTGGFSSDQMILTVTDRAPSGRLKWRFRMDAPYSAVRPARAADGTVYVIDVYSRLYSLSSNGGLNWLRSAGSKGLALGPDGTVYTASENDVRAFGPDGTLKWTFVQNPRAFNMQGIATDATGNIYGVATNGMGIFSLTASGELRWQTPEPYVRPIVSYSELPIGPNGGSDQLYFYANHHTLGVRTSDGATVASFPAYSQPVVSPFDGSVHILSAAYTPFAQQLWNYPNGVTYSLPDVDSNGSHYHVAGGPTGWEMVSLSPNGALQWRLTMPKSVGPPDIDPTRSIAIVAGANTLDIPGFIQGVSLASHAIAWEQALPAEETQIFNGFTGTYGFNQFQDTRTKFSADGKTAYLVTAISGVGIRARCFLNAFDTGAGAPPPPPPQMKLRVATLDLVGQTTPFYAATVTIKIVDQDGVAVPGATVQGTWRTPSGTFSTTVTTSNAGMVSLFNGYGRGTYTFTVTNVTKSGYTFDRTSSVLRKSIRL